MLWKSRNQRSVLEVALSHGSYIPRAPVVYVVAFSDSMSVIDLLEQAAADTHPKVRLEVMERIKLLRDRHSESPNVVAIVNIGLIDSDSHVRRAAALASRQCSEPDPFLEILSCERVVTPRCVV
jgi:hypothetical protein